MSTRPSLKEDLEQRYQQQSVGGQGGDAKKIPMADDANPQGMLNLYNNSTVGGAGGDAKKIPMADDGIPMLEALYQKSPPLSIQGLDTTPYT